jgi:hypothetical protein
VTFGAEPTDKEVMEFIDKNWHRLQFSLPVDVAQTSENRKNLKRQLREAKKQMQSQGIGTKSQQALKLQQELVLSETICIFADKFVVNNETRS